MNENKSKYDQNRNLFARFFHGATLLSWIAALTLISYFSLTGDITDFLFSDDSDGFKTKTIKEYDAKVTDTYKKQNEEYRNEFHALFQYGSVQEILKRYGSSLTKLNKKATKEEINKAAKEFINNLAAEYSNAVVALECPTGRHVISYYTSLEKNPTPSISILDKIGKSGWQNLVQIQMQTKSGVRSEDLGFCTEDETRKIVDAYKKLHFIIKSRLSALARSTVNLDSIIIDLPDEFADTSKKSNLVLNQPEIQDWFATEREIIKKNAEARALFNTFLLLSAIGAFGALIFLIRDFISSSTEHKFSVFLFRPILGIFLAVAVFILDILAHSVISTSSIFEIRYEPLYILALAAGLLSDKVYNAVSIRANSAIKKYEENAEIATSTNVTQK